jgi:hypothetical protein
VNRVPVPVPGTAPRSAELGSTDEHTAHTEAELEAVIGMLREMDAVTIAIGHGRHISAIAAAAALAGAWPDRGGTVLAVVSWPAHAASWLRQARRLARAQPDAWVVADSPPGFAPVARRLAAEPGWAATRTLGFATLSDPTLVDLAGTEALHGMAGATSTGRTWRL